MYADRTGGQLQQANLALIAADKTFLEDAGAGVDKIRLSDQQGIVAGNVLLIDVGQPDIDEFIAIKSITAAATPDQPATVILHHPLAYEHRKNAVVRPVGAVLAGLPQNVTGKAMPGDTCVFVNVAGLAGATEVAAIGGAATEYHSLRTFAVTSDADGYYKLPPLSRVAQVVIEASKVVGPQIFTAKVEFRPDYSKRENLLDLVLSV